MRYDKDEEDGYVDYKEEESFHEGYSNKTKTSMDKHINIHISLKYKKLYQPKLYANEHYRQ